MPPTYLQYILRIGILSIFRHRQEKLICFSCGRQTDGIIVGRILLKGKWPRIRSKLLHHITVKIIYQIFQQIIPNTSGSDTLWKYFFALYILILIMIDINADLKTIAKTICHVIAGQCNVNVGWSKRTCIGTIRQRLLTPNHFCVFASTFSSSIVALTIAPTSNISLIE